MLDRSTKNFIVPPKTKPNLELNRYSTFFRNGLENIVLYQLTIFYTDLYLYLCFDRTTKPSNSCFDRSTKSLLKYYLMLYIGMRVLCSNSIWCKYISVSLFMLVCNGLYSWRIHPCLIQYKLTCNCCRHVETNF